MSKETELCCLIATHIICEACKGRWCAPCWADHKEGIAGQPWGPNKYAGHVVNVNGIPPIWRCGNKAVSSSPNMTAHGIPIVLSILGEI